MKLPAPVWGDAGISIPICQSGKLMDFVHQPAAQRGKFRFTRGRRREVSIRANVARSHSAPSGYPTGGAAPWQVVFRARRYSAAANRFFDKPLKARRDLPLTFHLPTEIQIPLGSVNE
jgi:hypothetical protein